MKKYRLKKNSERFQIVVGPHAGRQFAHGKIYNEIPVEYADMFDEVQDVATPEPAPAKPDKKQTREDKP